MSKKVLIQISKGFAVMILATLVTVGVSGLVSFGGISLTTIPGTISFAVELAVLAWITYCTVGFFTSRHFIKGSKNPGILWMSGLCIVSYTIALLLLGQLLSGVVLMSLLGTVVYSIVTTAVFWVFWAMGATLGLLTGVRTLRPVY